MQSILKYCPNDISQQEAGPGQSKRCRRNGREVGLRERKERCSDEGRKWSFESDGRANEEVHRDRQPQDGHHEPLCSGEKLRVTIWVNSLMHIVRELAPQDTKDRTDELVPKHGEVGVLASNSKICCTKYAFE